jgi:hypothetical protein
MHIAFDFVLRALIHLVSSIGFYINNVEPG